jgi:photosystem II stability/assembly factor-like uncharacterized protein
MSAVRRLTIVGLLVLLLCALALPAFAGAAAASPDFLSLSFVDRTHGWVSGVDDTAGTKRVWRTTDGGAQWAPVADQILAGNDLTFVAFANRAIGVWGYGGVEYTTDGGDTWHPALAGGGNHNQADFANGRRGWAGWSNGTSESGGGIARTDDGGKSWTAQLDMPGRDGSGGFSRVSAPTGKRCYVLKWGRSGGVYATATAGAQWVRRVLPAYEAKYRYYRDLDFPGASTGWAVGDAGRIVKTVDAGASWVMQRSGCAARLTAVDFIDGKVGYVVGAGGRVLKTTDGGTHWKPLKTGTTKGLTAVSFVDRTRGWVAGNNGALLRTTDGGRTWVALGI